MIAHDPVGLRRELRLVDHDEPDTLLRHNFRHRAATVALDRTMDLRGVQELLGHARVDTTQLHTAVSIERHLLANCLRLAL